MTACRLPPAGWTCSRESGHPGPCAALPEGQQPGACSPACVHLMEAALLSARLIETEEARDHALGLLNRWLSHHSVGGETDPCCGVAGDLVLETRVAVYPREEKAGPPNNFGLGEFPGPGPDGLIDAFPCRSCGVETLSILEFDMHGVVPACWAYLCRPCQAKARGDLAELRRMAEVPS